MNYDFLVSFFPESRKRLERAVMHMKAFSDEWDRTVHPDSYEVITEPNSDWTAGYVRAVRKVSSENNMALELGEFFYQLRAALDALIYQAAMFLEHAGVPSNEEGLYFPICVKPRSFRDSPINAPPFPEDLRKWIESIQPYKAQDTTNADMLETIRVLQLIHDCARMDRHRRLHVVAAFPTKLLYRFVADPTTIKITNIRGVRSDFLEDESPFVFFDIEGADPIRGNNHVKLETDLRLEVAVDQITIPPGGCLDTEIKKMCIAVDHVIRYFEDGFVL